MKQLFNACEGILNVINQDKDGDYFICKEAKGSIDLLQLTLDQAKEEYHANRFPKE